MKTLVVLLCLSAVAAARPDSPGSTDMYRFAPGDVVEHVDTVHFRIFFTRAGVNAVQPDDADMNGIPDDVDEVSALYEDVLAFYVGRGYHAPISDAALADNGGDGRFDVYLVDFALKADGIFVRQGCDANGLCSGYMVQENDFAGYGYPSRTYGNRVLSSHEFFHAVQASYDNGESTVFLEGTAVWSTEEFDSTLNDLEGFVGGYLSRPDHSLDLPLPGPVDAFSYGSAIFFQFLGEKYGPVIIRELWEGAVGAPTWFDVIDAVLQTHGSSFAEAFFTFARWNLFTGRRADPTQSYAGGKGYPILTMETGALPLTAPMLRVFESSTSYTMLPVGGRASVSVSLVVTDGSNLHLALAVLRGSVVSAPVVAGPDLSATVDSDGADGVIAVVVNTAQSGESSKPGMCAGTSDEVAACMAMLAPPPPTMMVAKSGCSTVPGRPANGAAVVLGLAVAFLLRRTKRHYDVANSRSLSRCPRR